MTPWRAILATTLAGCALAVQAATGTAVPTMSSYDSAVQQFMQRWSVPGAAVAVVRDGRLVFARGYGLADVATGAAVQPDSLFRIASVSKPITSAAVMKLVEDGGLLLDLAVFPYLGLGTPSDSRLNLITVRHLLEHTGGWDRDIAGDPMFMPTQIAAAMGVASPPDVDTIARWMLTQPLQAAPGAKYAYSNFGYMVLGKVVEKASGQRYADYVSNMLRRAGITRMRPGATLASGRAADEVTYAMEPGASLASSVFASAPGSVPWPYGGFALEPMIAHGGWLASAIDLAAFATAMDGDVARSDLVGAASLAEIARRPSHVSSAATGWYGKGWSINTYGNWWHTGSLPGTASLLVRASNGMKWAVVMNLRSAAQSALFFSELDQMMWTAYAGVTAWPTEDQFAAWGLANRVPGCAGTASFMAGELCLPEVVLPGASSRYSATLALTDPSTFTFALSSATPVTASQGDVASYDPATGVVLLPRVVLIDASGTAKAWTARLARVAGGNNLHFRLLDASRLP
jgi:CubicO group peptidase (beta-lactamase class C family)